MSTSVATAPRADVKAVTQPGDMSHRQILETMTGLLAALFTALLSSTIVATALPTIIGDLNGTQRQYTWVITASLLATTVTTPIWGKFSDLFSKKLLVQLAIIVFVAGSIGAGFAHNTEFLIGMRVVQGLGMGGLTALVQSIMGSIIAPRERGRYSGYMGAVMAVSTVSGPLLGGVIVDSPLGWRWCFFVCVPLAVISLFILQATLKINTERRSPKIDYLGAILIAAGASLPLLWVTFAGDDFAWVSWQTAAYLGSAAVLIFLAVLVEKRAAEPMIPLKLLGNRTAILVIIASAAVGVALFGGSTFLGQYFQLARGYSPTRAGLLTIPLMLALLVSSTGAGQIISRTGKWKKFLVGGGVFLVAGLIGLGTIDHLTPIWHIGVFMALMGFGLGAMMQNLVLAVQNSVDVRDIGAVSATVAFFRSLGGAVGVSVLGAILATSVHDDVAKGLAGLGISGGGGTSTLDLNGLPAPVLAIVRAAYGDATGHIFLIGAACAAVALITVIFVKEVPLRTTVKLAAPAELAEAAGAIAGEDVIAQPDGTQPAYVNASADDSPTEPDNAALAAGRPDHVVAARQQSVTRQADAHREAPQPAAASAGLQRSAETPQSDFDTASLDDPSQRLSVAALDVLAAAQDQARQHLATSQGSHHEVARIIDGIGSEVDQALARFHAELESIKDRLGAQDSGASLGEDGVGGDSLRSYEFGLLLNSQRTADRVTQVARTEAERVLAHADDQVAELEKRIEMLREVETDLQRKVAEQLRTQV